MNAFERVMNTLHGKPTDRAPVFAVLGAYGGKLTHTDLQTLYSDAEAYVAGQCAAQEAFGLDLVLAPFDLSAIAEAFGAEVAWFVDQAPNIRYPAVRSAGAAIRLPSPDPRRSGRLPSSWKLPSDFRKCTAGACLCLLCCPARAPCLHSYWQWKAGWKPYCSTKRPPGCFWTTRASFTWPGPGPCWNPALPSRGWRGGDILAKLVRRGASPSPEGHVRVRAGPM